MTLHHHHHPNHVHPSPTVPPSLIRLSLGSRLLTVGAIVLLVWALVLWAIA
jgi:hypothetical protein